MQKCAPFFILNTSTFEPSEIENILLTYLFISRINILKTDMLNFNIVKLFFITF